MLGHHIHLLSVEETEKAAVKDLLRPVDCWHLHVPFHTFGPREQSLHEFGLAGTHDVDVSVSNTRTTTTLDSFTVAGEDSLDRSIILDLNKSVHGLSGAALHDDVNGIVGSTRRLADKTGRAANTGDDLVLGCAIRELCFC